MIIIDNSPSAFIYQKENGLPIKTWTGDKTDCELYLYINMLKMTAKFDLDLKYVIFNVVKDDLTVDHEKFAEIVNSAINKPDYAKRTRDYRRAHYSRSPSKGRKPFLETRQEDEDYFQTCCIQTEMLPEALTYSTSSRKSMGSSNYESVRNHKSGTTAKSQQKLKGSSR